MNWNKLEEEEELEQIISRSKLRPQLIYKHSTRCSISSMVKSRLERSGPPPEDMEFYFLDLIRYRSLSDRIAQIFDVRHESPQVLIIRDGRAVYAASHTAIQMQMLHEHAN